MSDTLAPPLASAPLTIRMHADDNVAIVANDGGLPAGAALADGPVLVEKVPQGHKVALVPLPKGTAVLRYGVPIGFALEDIPAGAWVHERRLQMPDARGLALKVMGVPGKKLLAGESAAGTQDFIFINHPVFFANDPNRYLDLVKAASGEGLLGKLGIPLALGVRVTVDNLDILERWGELFSGHEILLRLDLGRGLGHPPLAVAGEGPAGRDGAGARGAQGHALGAFGVHAQRQLLDVQHDVDDVFPHAFQRREFVHDAVDLDRGHGRALQRRQENAAQGVAERHAETALEGLGDQARLALRVGARLDLRLLGTDQLLPVTFDHGCPSKTERRSLAPRQARQDRRR